MTAESVCGSYGAREERSQILTMNPIIALDNNRDHQVNASYLYPRSSFVLARFLNVERWALTISSRFPRKSQGRSACLHPRSPDTSPTSPGWYESSALSRFLHSAFAYDCAAWSILDISCSVRILAIETNVSWVFGMFLWSSSREHSSHPKFYCPARKFAQKRTRQSHGRGQCRIYIFTKTTETAPPFPEEHGTGNCDDADCPHEEAEVVARKRI